MLSIPQALPRIRATPPLSSPTPRCSASAANCSLSYRNRRLTPVVTAHLFLRQILEGNAPVPELQHRQVPLLGVRLLRGPPAPAGGLLPAPAPRRPGPLPPLRGARPRRPVRGRHRAFFLDGSSFSMPDTHELQEEFGQPGGQAPGCGFPTAHLLVQFDAHHGYLHRSSRPAAHPRHGARGLHAPGPAARRHRRRRPRLLLLRPPGSVQRRGLFGLFRADQRQIISFRPGRRHAGRPGQAGQAGLPRSRWLKRLGRDDQLVEYFKPAECPDWMGPQDYAALPASLVVRELRVPVRTPGCRVRVLTLVTTLLNPRRYPKAAAARLYALRWGVEVNLKHLKQTLGLDVLRCETRKGVLKELLMFVVVYNLVRRVMTEAARRQRVLPHRISFVDALRWLREAGAGRRCRRCGSTRNAPAGSSRGSRAPAQAVRPDEQTAGGIAAGIAPPNLTPGRRYDLTEVNNRGTREQGKARSAQGVCWPGVTGREGRCGLTTGSPGCRSSFCFLCCFVLPLRAVVFRNCLLPLSPSSATTPSASLLTSSTEEMHPEPVGPASRFCARLQIGRQPLPRIDIPQTQRLKHAEQHRCQFARPDRSRSVTVLPQHHRTAFHPLRRVVVHRHFGVFHEYHQPIPVFLQTLQHLLRAGCSADSPIPASACSCHPLDVPSQLPVRRLRTAAGVLSNASRRPSLSLYNSPIRPTQPNAQSSSFGQDCAASRKSRRTCAQQKASRISPSLTCFIAL